MSLPRLADKNAGVEESSKRSMAAVTSLARAIFA
jgi:hypothetical protein